MDILSIEETQNTPAIRCVKSEGVIELKGRSIPEDPVNFYKPFIDWVESYSNDAKPETTVYIHLLYFNTSTSHCLLRLFKHLDKIHKTGKTVIVNWFYDKDDDEFYDAGLDYSSICNFQFKMIEIF